MSAENNLERFGNYVFREPPPMVDGELELQLEKTLSYDPVRDWVPAYRFAMTHRHTGARMGRIDLRVGLTEQLRRIGGHIGYAVYQPYRGNRYATRACRLLLPFARELGLNPLLITCDPANIPSVKTIEALGGRLLKTHQVEVDPGVWRWTAVYEVRL
jgi:predicted acetyltransferase